MESSTPPAAPADHLEFFRAHPPFNSLDDGSLSRIVEAAELVQLAREDRVLTRGGDPARHVYLIRDGAVRLAKDEDVVLVLGEGDLFGFPSLTSGAPPAFDAITNRDTLAYRLPAELCKELLTGSAWTDFLLHALQERLRRTAVREAGSPGSMTEPVSVLIERKAVWLPPDASVKTAAGIMREYGISSVLVSGSVPGIVTDRDLRGRVLAAGLGPGTVLDDIATRPVRTLPMSAPLREAMAFMVTHQIHHLPVTDEQSIVGVVSVGDVIRHHSNTPLPPLP